MEHLGECKTEILPFDGTSYTVKASGHKLRGVVPTLKSIFFKNWSIKLVQADGRRKGTRHGQALGARVDRELTEHINKAPDARPPASTLHRYTQAALEALHRHNLEPIAAQVTCGSSKLHVGTAADILCSTGSSAGFGAAPCPETGAPGLVVVEVKCGFDSYLDHAQGVLPHLKGPDGAIPNTPSHQHALQLLTTRMLLRACYPQVHTRKKGGRTLGMALLHINRAGARLSAAPTWAWDSHTSATVRYHILGKRAHPKRKRPAEGKAKAVAAKRVKK